MEFGSDGGGGRDVRRPMNAFLIFCKRHRSIVKEKNPDLDNRSVTRILGDLWANLREDEKTVYTDLAKQYKDAFMKANPDYKWHNPEKVLGCQKSVLAITTPQKNLNMTPEVSITPGKLADPCNMGGLSLLLMAGEQSISSSKPAESPQSSQQSVTQIQEGTLQSSSQSAIISTSVIDSQGPQKLTCLENQSIQSPELQSSNTDHQNETENQAQPVSQTVQNQTLVSQSGPPETNGTRTVNQSVNRLVPCENQSTINQHGSSPRPEQIFSGGYMEQTFTSPNMESHMRMAQVFSSTAMTTNTLRSVNFSAGQTLLPTAGSGYTLPVSKPTDGCGESEKVIDPSALWNCVPAKTYISEVPDTKKGTFMSWNGMTAPTNKLPDTVSAKPLLYQAVSAPKMAPRSLLAEAFRDTIDRGSYSDIVKANSAGMKVMNFDNQGISYEGQAVKQELSRVNTLDGKENYTRSFPNTERKCDNPQSFINPGDEKKKDEESTMVTCGKLVVNHIIDRLYSSELMNASERIRERNVDEIDGQISGKSDLQADVKTETKNTGKDEAVEQTLDTPSSYNSNDLSDKSKLLNKAKVIKLKKKFLDRMELDKAANSAKSVNTNCSKKGRVKGSRKRQISTGTDSTECESEGIEDIMPVRKSRRRNRGQRYQELINEGIIQRSKERTAALQQNAPKEDSVDEDLQPVEALNSYVLPETAIRRIRKRTTSESAKDKMFHPEDPGRYKTGDFDLEAQIATLPACSVEKLGRKRGFGRQRHFSECFHTHRKLSESESFLLPNHGNRFSLKFSPKKSPREGNQPLVTGSRKRKARKHSITHMLPAPDNLVKNGKVKTEVDGLSPCLIKPPAELLPQKVGSPPGNNQMGQGAEPDSNFSPTISDPSECLGSENMAGCQHHWEPMDTVSGDGQVSSGLFQSCDRMYENRNETGCVNAFSKVEEMGIKQESQSREEIKQEIISKSEDKKDKKIVGNLECDGKEPLDVKNAPGADNKGKLSDTVDPVKFEMYKDKLSEEASRLDAVKVNCLDYMNPVLACYKAVSKDSDIGLLVQEGRDVNSNTTFKQ